MASTISRSIFLMVDSECVDVLLGEAESEFLFRHRGIFEEKTSDDCLCLRHLLFDFGGSCTVLITHFLEEELSEVASGCVFHG